MVFSIKKTISSFSVRKSRTPAQDRLNKVITKNAEIANTIRNDIKLPNNHKYSVQDRILKFRKKYEKRHRDKADTHRLSNEIYKSTSHLKHKETIVSNRENLSLLSKLFLSTKLFFPFYS